MIELNKIYQGNSLEILKTFPDNFVDCCITSTPYWGLRDYGTAIWLGGDPECNHRRDTKNKNPDWLIQTRGKVDNGVGDEIYKDVCGKCGSIRIDDQIGLEKTPEEFIGKLVIIFREVRRVMKPTGTLWINIGDSYFGGGGSSGHNSETKNLGRKTETYGSVKTASRKSDYLKPKDLVGILWMLAFALRADGWWLRSDIIWQKPNPMPESVTDRPTKSHEYVFLLTKSQHYYYDAEAIKEPMAEYERERRLREKKQGLTREPLKLARDGQTGLVDQSQSGAIRNLSKVHELAEIGMVNKKSVWTIATKPFPEAHFATFPTEIPELCIKAGSSECGCCIKCGKPWRRILNKQIIPHDGIANTKYDQKKDTAGRLAKLRNAARERGEEFSNKVKTTGWQPTCKCNAGIVPAVVLDNFSGAGTTSVVAQKLNRDWVVIELNKKYIQIHERRMQKEFGLFNKEVLT